MRKRTSLFLTLIIMLLPLLAACDSGSPTATPIAAQPTATTASEPATATTAMEPPTATTGTVSEATATTASSPAATNTTASGGTTSDAVLVLAGLTGVSFQRNFNPFVNNITVGAINGVYEPLMILNSVTSKLEPWLATKYEFSADNKTLTFTIRDGVKWSDGQAFSASDVAYTFNLIKNTPGVQSTILGALTGPTAYVDTVTAPDATTVVFTFSRVYTPGLYELIVQNIVSEHVWKAVTDPVKYVDDNPVGTGPFTEVANFQDQSYEMDRNPNYWQTGKPAFKGVRYLAFPDGSGQSLAMVNGQLDWSNPTIASPDQTFVAKDPTNNYYIPESTPNMATLALQIGKKPFDDPNVRKAISMAINREQITTVGETGLAAPADVTGLAPFYNAWKVADPTSLGDWATYNPDMANQLLDAAGLTKGSDGIRVLPDGTPMKYDVKLLPLPNWIADMQIVADNLKEVGIEISPVPSQFPDWLDAQMKGTYDMMFNIIDGNATPYRFFDNTMASKYLQPVGTQAFGNSTRYAGKKADALLDQFASTSDEAKQKEIAQQLQQVFAEEVPTVPLFPLSGAGYVNTTRFTGFPTKDNYYASASPNQSFFADFLLVVPNLVAK